MKGVSFLVSYYLSRLLLLFLGSILLHCSYKALLFGVFIDFVTHLSNDIIDLVAEFDNKFMALQPNIFLCPYQLS